MSCLRQFLFAQSSPCTVSFEILLWFGGGSYGGVGIIHIGRFEEVELIQVSLDWVNKGEPSGPGKWNYV